MGFVPGKRFRRDKMGCGARTLGVATGEEVWELRLVMKSENVRENMGFSGQMRLQSQLSRIKRFLTDECIFLILVDSIIEIITEKG